MRAKALYWATIVGALTVLTAGRVSAQAPSAAVSEQTFDSGWFSLVAPHPEGGFVVAGRRFAQDTESGITSDIQHPLVVRLGPDGRVRWTKAFTNRKRGEPQSLQVVPGGGIRLTGFGGVSFDKPTTIQRLDWMAELDSEGRVLLDSTLDLDRKDHEGTFIPITSSTFAFYGSTFIQTGAPGIDIFAADARGSILWRAKMPDVLDCPGAATADPDGNLVAVVGTVAPDQSPAGPRFRRFDARGGLSRDEPFSAFKGACPQAIRSVPGLGLVVTGTNVEGDGPAGWVALLDANGSLLWERQFGPDKTMAVANDAAVAPDGSVVVAGCIDGSTPEGIVVRYSRTGELTGERRFPSTYGINPAAAAVAKDGSIALGGVLEKRCGLISGNNSGGTAWVGVLPPEGLQAPAR